MLFIVAITLIISVLIIRKYRHKLKEVFSDNHSKEISNFYMKKIFQIKSECITVEELDRLFEIDHMEMESRKSKRHKIINQLNVDCHGLITRIKDENDKRKFLYMFDNKLLENFKLVCNQFETD